jgi:hypothetical protein
MPEDQGRAEAACADFKPGRVAGTPPRPLAHLCVACGWADARHPSKYRDDATSVGLESLTAEFLRGCEKALGYTASMPIGSERSRLIDSIFQVQGHAKLIARVGCLISPDNEVRQRAVAEDDEAARSYQRAQR